MAQLKQISPDIASLLFVCLYKIRAINFLILSKFLDCRFNISVTRNVYKVKRNHISLGDLRMQ